MKKFRIESATKIYTKSFHSIEEAIRFKSTLNKYQHWNIREVRDDKANKKKDERVCK